jgi:hypothetical protein
LDVAVVENGPTAGNPIGHTAVAVMGVGVYSYGNNTPAGSSLKEYLHREAPRRDTKVYVIKITPEQDAAVLKYLGGFPKMTLPGDWLSILFQDNCSVRSNGALDAAGVPNPTSIDPLRYGAPLLTPSHPGSSGYRARAANATIYSMPRGSTSTPPVLEQFERP